MYSNCQEGLEMQQKPKEIKEQEERQREAQRAIFAKLVETQQQGHDGDIIAREAKYYEV